MKTVGSGLAHHGLESAAEPSVLGVKGRRNQLELVKGLESGEVENSATGFRDGEAGAVDLDFPGAAAGAVDTQLGGGVDAGHVSDERLRVPEGSVEQRQVR